MSCSLSSSSAASFGQRALELVRDMPPSLVRRLGVGLQKGLADGGGVHGVLPLRPVGSRAVLLGLLKGLVERGLKGVKLVISDAERGCAWRSLACSAPAGKCLWLDATYLKVRDGGRIVSVAAIIAVAFTTDGRREIIGLGRRDLARGFFNF